MDFILLITLLHQVTFIDIITQNYQNIIFIDFGSFKSNCIATHKNSNFLDKIFFSTFRKLGVDILFARFLKINNSLSVRFLNIALHYCQLHTIIY